ncbi:MAG: hypothetical protein FJ344_00780 [Sphingomonadales bacterium]|nr:hypothetical protein [Sphingomonadales bacterium]
MYMLIQNAPLVSDGWTTFTREAIQSTLPDYVISIVRSGLLSGQKLRVCVGTDSQQYTRHTEFASVVVIYKVGQGGSILMRRFRETREMSLRERLMHEVTLSIDIAWQLLEPLQSLGATVEVHADINQDPRFPSHIAYQEARGYVRGMGLTFKAKPDAFASSCCADALVH